jgi:pyruvate/2-oxoglutarate dehydrogenase complex dihydrolipoamide dehydrogenase (E3) component
LGTKVTLIARGDRILKKESAAASASIEQIFIREGIDLRSKTDVLECKQKQNRCELKLRSSKQTETVIVEKILVATGRTPNTAKLKLENAGVEFDKRGIGTDAKLRTNQKHIYAIGDINGKFQFTHTAGYEGGIVVSNAILKIPRKVDYGNIPKTTFTDPEVATCGMSEAELQEQNIDYRVWHHSYKKQDRALAEGETDGFIKLFTSGKRAKVVGAEIIGAHAGELIHACILARNAQLTLATIAGSVFVYPTLSEIEKTAAGAFFSEKLFTNKTRKFLRLLFKYRG